MTDAAAAAGRIARLARLREFMERRGLRALLLRRHANFAWYTGGADTRVDHASPLGVADIVITGDGEYVFTSTIEAPRMRTEQTPELEVVEYPWYEDPGDTLGELVQGGPLGADVEIGDSTAVGEEVAELRRVLDPDAIDRIRRVGQDAAAAMAEAAKAVAPGQTEEEAAASLASACRRRGLSSSVLLAGADDRIARYRHPCPAGATIERRVMLVASAERWGLYANLTRFVYFEEPGTDLRRRHAACDEILARMREEATLPGQTLGDAFDSCRRFYAEAGFPDEWKLHHQGGSTGYGSREVIANPSTHDEIRVGQAFAWNPSVRGAKAEETFVITEAGAEVITGAPAPAA
jgi:Xaa-Pro aminopeptidase